MLRLRCWLHHRHAWFRNTYKVPDPCPFCGVALIARPAFKLTRTHVRALSVVVPGAIWLAASVPFFRCSHSLNRHGLRGAHDVFHMVMVTGWGLTAAAVVIGALFAVVLAYLELWSD